MLLKGTRQQLRVHTYDVLASKIEHVHASYDLARKVFTTSSPSCSTSLTAKLVESEKMLQQNLNHYCGL